jgi:transposase-like protein
MKKRKRQHGEESKQLLGGTEGARRATGVPPNGAALVGPLGPGQRWSVLRKREVVLRLLRGESMEALSRELGVEIHRLQAWRDRALSGIDESLREREGDPLQAEFDAAIKRVGELSMENELLRDKIRAAGPLGWGRSRR